MKITEAFELDQPITTEVIRDELEISTPIQAMVFLRRSIEVSPFEFVTFDLPDDLTSDLNKISCLLMADKPSRVLLDLIKFSEYLATTNKVNSARAASINFLEKSVELGNFRVIRDFIWHDHLSDMFGFTEYFMMGVMILSSPILREAYESLLEAETIKKEAYLRKLVAHSKLLRDTVNEEIRSNSLPLAPGPRNFDNN